MYKRLCKPSKKNSFFLFGSRGTGKSTLLEAYFPDSTSVLRYDLLDELVLGRLSQSPEVILDDLQRFKGQSTPWIILDEVQRLPSLLNAVHRMIEKHKLRFALTGSSARKLKHGGANLLAGRAFVYHLYPLTHVEMGGDFVLEDALNWGSLPHLTQLQSPLEKREYLNAYVNTYLKEEIKEEQLVRNVDPFRRFLEVAAQASGKILNYSKIARDSRSDDSSVKRYFEILEDTLLGMRLDPFHHSIRKRESEKPKFYLFDLGVQRAMTRSLSVPLQKGTGAYGEAFENWIIWECLRLSEYLRKDFRFSYLRTKDDVEIDLIIERPGQATILLEVKSGSLLDAAAFRAQSELVTSFKKKQGNVTPLIAYQGQETMQIGAFTALPWKQALQEIFETTSLK